MSRNTSFINANETCLVAGRQPIKGYDKKENIHYQIHLPGLRRKVGDEIKDLHKSIGWDIPLRGFKIIERKLSKTNRLSVGTKIPSSVLLRFLNGKRTSSPSETEANVVRKIVHAKCGIENNGIKDLK